MQAMRNPSSHKRVPIPEHVRGLVWKIDERHSVAFNEYGSVDLIDSTGIGGDYAYSIEDTKRIGQVFLSAIAAYEQAPVVVDVKPVDMQAEKLAKAIASLEERIASSQTELGKMRAELAERIGNSPSATEASP